MKSRTARRRRAYRYAREFLAKYPETALPVSYWGSEAARRRFLVASGGRRFMPQRGRAS